jgi:hypothetical protein
MLGETRIKGIPAIPRKVKTPRQIVSVKMGGDVPLDCAFKALASKEIFQLSWGNRLIPPFPPVFCHVLNERARS